MYNGMDKVNYLHELALRFACFYNKLKKYGAMVGLTNSPKILGSVPLISHWHYAYSLP